MVKPFLNRLSGKPIKSDVTTFTGGLNTCYDRTMIQDNQFTYLWNMSFKDTMSMTTRSDRLSMAWFMEDTTSWGTGKIMKIFATTEETFFTIETTNMRTEVYLHKRVGAYMVKSYVGAVETTSKYFMTECRDSTNKYVFIGTYNKLYKITIGLTVTLSEVDDAPTGLVCDHKNRLFVAKGTKITFSNLRQFDSFEIDDDDPVNTAGEINITNARGNIVAMIPFDDKLMIFCNRSRHILYGDTPNPELNQFQLVDLDDGIGTISDETVCVVDRMLYFVDRDLSVYRFNGSSSVKVSEPYGTDNYASYGGIAGITYNSDSLNDFILNGHQNYLYFGVRNTIESGIGNDTFFVYDTKNRIWSAEDGAISHMAFMDTNGFYGVGTDILLGVRYNNDIVLLDYSKNGLTDKLFNMETRDFDDIPIEYGFETKTWNLGEIKKKKTLTNVWFQADADAEVGVCDYWTNHGKEPDFKDNYLVLGRLKPVGVRHNVQHPYYWLHEGNERQRFIIPRMYMQKINAFSIRVEGKGDSKFFLMQKEWREA